MLDAVVAKQLGLTKAWLGFVSIAQPVAPRFSAL
jgi:hypothetical protein